MMVMARNLESGDYIVIRGERFTVMVRYESFQGLTEFITDDGLTRKFPDIYEFERVG